MDNGHLVRYSAPTKFDTAEYGMMWHQILDNEQKIFIQVSKDEENSQWIEISKFFEKVFVPKLQDEQFVLDCLRQYYNHAPHITFDDCMTIHSFDTEDTRKKMKPITEKDKK